MPWNTVGHILTRVYHSKEPDIRNRWNNLQFIGIDETSYCKRHKYITVVVNHDTNIVIWAHEGHGKEILALFMKSLSKEQGRSIKVVTGAGARWDAKNTLKARNRAKVVKNSAYALGKAPQNLTDTQKAKLEIIEKEDKRLY